MAESETGPPEKDVENLCFHQLSRLKIFDDKPETLTPKERCQLLAVSSTYGYTFAGCDSGLKILKTSDIVDIHEQHQDTKNAVVDSYSCMKVPLDFRPVHLALGGNDLILSVCSMTDDGLLVALFDVRTLVHKSTNASPFASKILSKEGGTQLVNLLWNPTVVTYFATCLSDGTMALWDCADNGIKSVAQLPTGDIQPTAMCWSPKGKQIVIGTSSGKLMQFNQKLEQKRLIPSADFSTEPIKVVDILWLSTYVFAVAYIDAEETLQPNLAIVSAPKEGRITFCNFEDVCFGSGESRTAQYQFLNVDKMGFFVVCSSNSMEAVIIGCSSGDKASWEIWTLDDSARIEMPLSADDDDTFPMGLALDMTSQAPFRIGTKTYQPPPIVMVLSTEGLLCPYYALDSNMTETITSMAKPLPVEGARMPTRKAAVTEATFAQPKAPPETAKQGSSLAGHAPTPTATPPIVHRSSSTGSFPSTASSSSLSSFLASTTSVPGALPAAGQTDRPGGFSSFYFSRPGGTGSPSPLSTFGSKGEVSKPFGIAKPEGAGASVPALKATPASTSLPPFQLKLPGGLATSDAGKQVQQPSAAQGVPEQTDSIKAPGSLTAPKQVGFGQQPSGATFGNRTAFNQPQASTFAPPNAQAPSQVTVPPPNQMASMPRPGLAPNQTAPSQGVPGFQPSQLAQQMGYPGQVAAPSGLTSRPPPPAYADPSASTKPTPPSAQAPMASTPVTRPQPPAVQTPASAAPATQGASIKPKERGSFPGTPLEAAHLTNLSAEIEHFNKELAELLNHRTHYKVGDSSEHELIKKSTDDLVKFRSEVRDVTKSHNEEIHELKSKLLGTFAQLEDARVLKQRNSDPRYLSLLRLRGLDPQTAQQLRDIQSNYHYLQTGLGDVNGCLDAQWEEFQQRKSHREGRKLSTPTMDTIYQTLSHHYNILISQRGKLEELRQQLIQARRYDITEAQWERGMLSPTSSGTGDLSSLSAQLSSTQITSPPKVVGTPVSSKKQAQLRKALTRRATTPRRTASRVDISELGSPAPSHGSHDHIFSSLANRRLHYLDEEPAEKPPVGMRPAAVGLDSPDLRPGSSSGQARPVGARSSLEFAGLPSRKLEGMGGLPSAEMRQAVPAAVSVPQAVPQAGAGNFNLPSTQARPVTTAAATTATTTSTATTSPSGFTHSGRGTVNWGTQMGPSKPPSTTRSSAPRKSPEKQPDLPPVVNIKNLNIKQEVVVPPMTFAPVNNTVDAGTVKVVNQVLAEITKTSGYGQPEPSGQHTERKISFSEEPPRPPVVQSVPPSKAISMKAGGSSTFSFGALKTPTAQPLTVSTSGIPPAATTSGPAPSAPVTKPGVSFAPSALNSGPKFGNSATFSGSTFGASVATSAGPTFGSSAAASGGTFSSMASSSGSLFGAKKEGTSAPPNATAQGLSTGFPAALGTPATLGTSTQPSLKSNEAAAKPVFGASVSGANASSFSFAAPQQSASSVQFSSGDSSAGVKPSLFDFKTQKAEASSSTPVGFFAASNKPVTEPSQEQVSSGMPPAPPGPPTEVPKPSFGVVPIVTAPPSAPAVQPTATPAPTAGGLGVSQAAVKPFAAAGGGGGNTGLKQLLAGEDEAGTGVSTTKPSFAGFGTASISQPSGEDEAGTGIKPAPSDTKDSVPAAPTGLFGKPAAAPADSTAGGLFGAKAGTSGPFGTSTTSASSSAVPGPTTGFGASSFGMAPSAGLFGAPKFGAPPTATGSSSAAPASTTATTSTAGSSKPTSQTTLFGLLKEDDPVSSSTGGNTLFGSSGASTASTTGKNLFSQTTSTAPSPFGQSAGSSGGLFGQQPATAASSGNGGVFGKPSGIFGQSAAPTSTSSVFGQAPATTSTGGMFEQKTSASLSPFQQGGSGGPFGTAATSSAFGQKSTGVFGSASNTPPAFGQAPSVFGQSSGATTHSSVFGDASGDSGGGFFSGLGGRPNPEAAKTNPFGTPTSSSSFGSSGGSTMFGGQSATTFGSSANNSGSVFGGGAGGGNGGFTSPSSGVGKSGFGGFGQPPGATSPGFGSAPSFGSPPAFGSAPAFGGTAFGSTSGQGMTSPFGQSSAFGAGSSSPQVASGFSGFASQETPTFGALSGGGAKTTQSGFGGFGAGTSQPSFGSTGFGSGSGSPANQSGGFGSSSSFTQYR